MIKIMIALLIIAFGGLFFIKGPGGEPFLTLEDLKPDLSLPDAGSLTASKEDPDETSGKPVKVYRWKDDEGNWHFSNKEEDAEGAELMEVQETNTIPAFKAPPREKKTKVAASQPVTAPIPGIGQGIDTLNQAKQLQSTIDQRKADLDKVLQADGQQ
jgi:hypothetical protein|tara:strand:- start:1189 stop:1659 length:471 start_codon:yes stop_codon:yes gene_type:complete